MEASAHRRLGRRHVCVHRSAVSQDDALFLADLSVPRAAGRILSGGAVGSRQSSVVMAVANFATVSQYSENTRAARRRVDCTCRRRLYPLMGNCVHDLSLIHISEPTRL